MLDAIYARSTAAAVGELSSQATDWLWVATGIFLVVFLVLLVFCFTAPEFDRVFHYLFTITLLIGATTTFAQSAHLGWFVPGQNGDLDNENASQICFVRYVYWAAAFPATALGLGLLSGVSWTTIFTNITITWLWVITYLAGASTNTSYKWGFFAFGTLSWIILAASTLNESREAAVRSSISGDYMILAGWANLIWLLYVVAWGLSDGSGYLGVSASAIFFSVLDVLMLPPLGAAFVLMSRKWDFQKLHLDLSEHRFLPHEGDTKDAAEGQNLV